jgi:hypothetical protein
MNAPKAKSGRLLWWLLGAFLLVSIWLYPGKQRAIQKEAELASPECNIGKVDGSMSQRRCDLKQLCVERELAEKKLDSRHKRAAETARKPLGLITDSDVARLADLADAIDESEEELRSIDVQLSRYKTEDQQRVCGLVHATPKAPQKAKSLNMPVKAEHAGIPRCDTSPMELFETGQDYPYLEIDKLLLLHCSKAPVEVIDNDPSRRYVQVLWEANKYRVMFSVLKPDANGLRFRVDRVTTQ